MKKLIKLLQTITRDTRARFLLVGGLNTFVGFGLYASFLFIGMPYLLAQFTATVLAVIHSYIWNRKFTFRSTGQKRLEVLRFVSVYLVGYLINMLILFISVDFLKCNPYFGGALTLIITTLASYFGHRFFSFRRMNHQPQTTSDS